MSAAAAAVIVVSAAAVEIPAVITAPVVAAAAEDQDEDDDEPQAGAVVGSVVKPHDSHLTLRYSMRRAPERSLTVSKNAKSKFVLSHSVGTENMEVPMSDYKRGDITQEEYHEAINDLIELDRDWMTF